MVRLPTKEETMGILFVYLILFSLIGLLAWQLSFSSLNRHELIQIFCYSFAAGGIGASLYSIRMLYYHSHLDKNNSNFKNEGIKEFVWGWGWFWFYFNRPIMGAFVGFITYVLFVGGLFNENSLSIKNNQSIILAIGLGWLAGYNVSDLISRLESVASSIFGFEKEETPFGRLKNLVHPPHTVLPNTLTSENKTSSSINAITLHEKSG